MDKKAFKREERELARVHGRFNSDVDVLGKNFDVLLEPLKGEVKELGYLLCVHVTAERLKVSVFRDPSEGCSLVFNRSGIIDFPADDVDADVLAVVEAWIEEYRDGE